ncbi:hypothetical protein ACFY36_31890 [Actinoplanes sp. NPDC000266]
MRRFPRRTALVVAVTVLSAFVSVPPAAAFDGRVPDSRSRTPAGELTAYYWHGLDRDPDSSGFAMYSAFAGKDCRWGLLDAGVRILDSTEAHRKWRTNEAKAGAIYASLLNRGPRAAELKFSRAAIADHGMRWAISRVQASAEFRGRLSAICAGRKSSNAGVWAGGDAIVKAIGINNGAEDLVKACGVGLLIDTFAPIRVLYRAPLKIKAAKLAAGQVVVRTGGACIAAYRMLQAADEIATTTNYGVENNPVFVEVDTRSRWTVTGRWCDTSVRVGPAVTAWGTAHKATYRC